MKSLNIATKRLYIRSLVHGDLDDFHIYRSNPEVTRYQGFDVMTRAQAEIFINENAAKEFGKAGEWVQYAIENKATGKRTGDCAIKLDQYDTRIAEIGITISHLQQKQGFAKEALTGILSFLFHKQLIHRVVETVDTENLASVNLLKSVGFRLEGHFIENIFFKGKWGSEFQYAMLKRECDEGKDRAGTLKKLTL